MANRLGKAVTVAFGEESSVANSNDDKEANRHWNCIGMFCRTCVVFPSVITVYDGIKIPTNLCSNIDRGFIIRCTNRSISWCLIDRTLDINIVLFVEMIDKYD